MKQSDPKHKRNALFDRCFVSVLCTNCLIGFSGMGDLSSVPGFLYTFRSKKLPAQPVSSRKIFRFKLRRKASWSTLSLDCRSKPKVNQEAKQCQKTTQIVYHTPDGIASTISYLRQNFVDRLCTVRLKRASGKFSGRCASRRKWRYWKPTHVQITFTCW